MSEIIFVVLLVFGMLGAGIYVGVSTKKWHLLWVFLTFFACFGFWEWHATATTGMTVSQQVWAFGEEHPVGLWAGVIVPLVVSWGALMWHFTEKARKK